MWKPKTITKTQQKSSQIVVYVRRVYVCVLYIWQQISVSPESRNTAWVSFDGRSRQELKHGDRWVCLIQTKKQNKKTTKKKQKTIPLT
jgi:NAD kinase